jgi:hypothetical protein
LTDTTSNAGGFGVTVLAAAGLPWLCAEAARVKQAAERSAAVAADCRKEEVRPVIVRPNLS